MKKLSKFAVICFTGALTLSVSFMHTKDLTKAEAITQALPTLKVALPVPFVNKGSVEVDIPAVEQNRVEHSTVPLPAPFPIKSNVTVVISAEEQNRVEHTHQLY